MTATTRSINQPNRQINNLFWLVAGAMVLIALGSFVLSYAALVELAADNGVRGWLAYVWPLIVDVSVVVFTAAILVAQLQRRGAKLPISLTVFYALVTIAGNVLHAPPTALGWFVAVLPPLSLIAATEVLRAMAHHTIAHSETARSLAELQAKAQQLAQQIADDAQQAAQQKSEMAQQAAQLRAEIEQLEAQREKAATGEIDPVTRQMYQIDGLLAAGKSQVEAARIVGISPSTVRNRVAGLNGDSLLHRAEVR